MKNAAALTVTNGTLVTPDGLVEGSIRLEGGTIAALGPQVKAREGEETLNARGKLIAPGLVDLGVFSVDKPCPYQILGQDTDFLRFYEGLSSFSKMAACHTIQDGGINVGRVY